MTTQQHKKQQPLRHDFKFHEMYFCLILESLMIILIPLSQFKSEKNPSKSWPRSDPTPSTMALAFHTRRFVCLSVNRINQKLNNRFLRHWKRNNALKFGGALVSIWVESGSICNPQLGMSQYQILA